MFNTRSIFAFAADAQESGQRVVLVTLYAVAGTSSRNPGAHLAVREDGTFAGSLSDGCIEGTIVSEALDVLATGGARELRLGQGSRYIDIRLPCGGSLDLLFSELPSGIGPAILDRIDARQSFGLRLPCNAMPPEILPGSGRFSAWRGGDCVAVQHVPELRLVVMGHGPTVACLHDLALSAHVDVLAATPDERIARRLANDGAEPLILKGLGSIPQPPLGRWTACTLFFHDHDWEPALLGPILASDAFFIGAMGSRSTHRQRCERLAAMGIPAHAIARISAPIGLIPSLRDPETLAVSTLAQVIDAYNRTWLTPVQDTAAKP